MSPGVVAAHGRLLRPRTLSSHRPCCCDGIVKVSLDDMTKHLRRFSRTAPEGTAKEGPTISSTIRPTGRTTPTLRSARAGG